MPTARDILAAIEREEPGIARAFSAWVAELVDPDVSVAALTRAVESGDANAIAVALGIDAASLAVLVDAVYRAFTAGGDYQVREIPPLRAPGRFSALRVRFDVRNLRAEAWLREHSARLIVEILQEQRAVIRTLLNEGTMLGRNPRATALELVGRVDVTGRRSGGVIGLTEQQAGYVVAARRELASGDPDQLRHYLTRQRRDRRFDAAVQRAIAAERPVPPAQRARMTARYSDRLLQYRGETIARTEALTAFNAARDEAMRQALEQTGRRPDAATKVWQSAADARVRETHRSMNGQRVDMAAPFRSPSGAHLMFPGDTSLGAGGSEVIGCRCIAQYKIDHLRRPRRGRG